MASRSRITHTAFAALLTSLLAVRPDGHGLRQITSGNGGDEADWSPDDAIGPDGTHLHRILGLSRFKPRNIDWGPR